MREKLGKSRNTVFFQWFVALEGRKVGSLKRRVRSQLAKWEMKNCTPLWREHICKSKCTKHTMLGPLLEVEMSKKNNKDFNRLYENIIQTALEENLLSIQFVPKNYQKVHAVVARSTVRTQNVQNTPAPDHFWQLRCRKSARRCGAKHISKSKCTKHLSVGPLLEVEMWKKCTPLWREAHLEVKMLKTLGVRTTFGSSDLEKLHAFVARSTFWSQNVKNTRGSDHFWRLRCRFASLRVTTLHYTLHYTTLQYITLYYTPQHYNYRTTELHNYTPLHSTTLHYTKLHYTTPRYTTLHYTTLHYTTLHYLPLHFTTLHPTTLHYNYNYDYTTTLHYAPLH